jgi:hypothetical protein
MPQIEFSVVSRKLLQKPSRQGEKPGFRFTFTFVVIQRKRILAALDEDKFLYGVTVLLGAFDQYWI